MGSAITPHLLVEGVREFVEVFGDRYQDVVRDDSWQYLPNTSGRKNNLGVVMGTDPASYRHHFCFLQILDADDLHHR